MKKRLVELIRIFKREIGLYQSIIQDSRCPRLARWLLCGSIAYAISPIDLIPDFIPVIGHLDDVIILPILIWLAIRTIPKELIDEHRLCRNNTENTLNNSTSPLKSN